MVIDVFCVPLAMDCDVVLITSCDPFEICVARICFLLYWLQVMILSTLASAFGSRCLNASWTVFS